MLDAAQHHVPGVAGRIDVVKGRAAPVALVLHDVVALLAVTDPELFHTREMTGDIETRGELTTGATVFDRRNHPVTHHNMDVAMEIDPAAALDCIIRGLQLAGRCT